MEFGLAEQVCQRPCRPCSALLWEHCCRRGRVCPFLSTGELTLTQHEKLLLWNSIARAAFPKGQKCLWGVSLCGVPLTRAYLVLSTLRPPIHCQHAVRIMTPTHPLPDEAHFSLSPDSGTFCLSLRKKAVLGLMHPQPPDNKHPHGPACWKQMSWNSTQITLRCF